MRIKRMHFGSWPAYSTLLSFFWLAGLASAQSMPSQTNNDDRSVQDRDDRRQEQARFDQFLDSHREIAEQLRKDPSLVNDPKFVKNHPPLQDYLKQHPGVSDALKDNPNAFMKQEDRYDRQEAYRDRDANQGELARFDQYLDRHRDTAEQLRKDPSLVNNKQYLKDHPDLQAYLQEHPGVRQQIQNDPNAFMQREERFDARTDNARDSERAARERDDRSMTKNATNQDAENRGDQDRDHDANRDRDANRQQLAQFDRFLDGHRETAEQLRKDPSLIDNRQFLKDHPALQSYLQEHPETREQVKQDPDAFMQQEARYDRREDDMTRQDRDREATNRGDRDAIDRDRDRHNNIERFDRDGQHNHAASFGQFLGEHSNIAQQLSKNPAMVKNRDYLQDHPELQSYLTAHPEVREELMANPQGFVKSAQQYNESQGTTGQGMKSPNATAPTTDPKPKPNDTKPPMQ